MEVRDQLHLPAALPHRKRPRYSLCIRMGGPQSSTKRKMFNTARNWTSVPQPSRSSLSVEFCILNQTTYNVLTNYSKVIINTIIVIIHYCHKIWEWITNSSFRLFVIPLFQQIGIKIIHTKTKLKTWTPDYSKQHSTTEEEAIHSLWRLE